MKIHINLKHPNKFWNANNCNNWKRCIMQMGRNGLAVPVEKFPKVNKYWHSIKESTNLKLTKTKMKTYLNAQTVHTELYARIIQYSHLDTHFPCVPSVWLFSTVFFQMSSQTACTRGCKVTLIAFVWLFSTVRFQMLSQIACIRGCKITLVAFVWLFFTVRFQMCPQIPCLNRCIVTLVAFVWLFSTVRF